MKAKELEKVYDITRKIKLQIIKSDNNKLRMLFNLILHYTTFPFVWLWVNLRDIKTFIIFVIVFLVLSCEVWIPYAIGFITQNAWWFGIGSACWGFWLLPGTPFLPLCVVITLFIKGIIGI